MMRLKSFRRKKIQKTSKKYLTDESSEGITRLRRCGTEQKLSARGGSLTSEERVGKKSFEFDHSAPTKVGVELDQILFNWRV